MQYKTILLTLGTLLMLFSLSMLPPIAVSLYYHEHHLSPFLTSFSITFLCGFVLTLLFHHNRNELSNRDGFLLVVLFWVVLSLFGTLPFIFVMHPTLNFTDALFESVSGLTTTGGSVITGLDHLAHGILYYRQQLQFLGGMGIIVLAVAILPLLGVGGMQLYRAETPGPLKDAKLTPRIAETAKTLWLIYIVLTASCAIAFWLAGMPLFDAIGNSFSTVSTGGFSLHDTSFSYYHSHTIELLCVLFMFLGSVNFTLHFIGLNRGTLKQYWQDSECRSYVFFITIVTTLTIAILFEHHFYHDFYHTLCAALFNVTSLISTSGFTTGHFATWPSLVPFMIMFAALVGGCASSTAGGLKMIRLVLLLKQCGREMKRLIHPQAILPLKFGQTIMPEHIIQAMWSFIAAYVGLFFLLYLALLATGLDQTTALGALIAALANAGAGIGGVVNGFGLLPNSAKWILIIGMLLGRLEIFTVMILFSRAFWRG